MGGLFFALRLPARAFFLFAFFFSALAEARVTFVLQAPMNRQVVQRNTQTNLGNIPVIGSVSGTTFDAVQAFTSIASGYSGNPNSHWTPLALFQKQGTHFNGVLPTYAGGYYDVHLRALRKGRVVASTTVPLVGVGEVFILAGQSNSTNSGQATGFLPDPRVASFNGRAWKYGQDPLLCPDQTAGGSPWPLMASNLAVALNMPIGLQCTGYGGTEIARWLPDAAPIAELGVNLFTNLANAVKRLSILGGVRAILWDQGESDCAIFDASGSHDPQLYANNYRNSLNALIFHIHAQTSVYVKFVIALVGGGPGADLNYMALQRQAQESLIDHTNVFLGPNTDDLIDLSYRWNGIHFNRDGLKILGNWWGISIFNQPGVLD